MINFRKGTTKLRGYCSFERVMKGTDDLFFECMLKFDFGG
jgi:hypothetical protein